MAGVVMFESVAHELAETQLALDELLQKLAAGGGPPTDHELLRLEKLASACAKLAYPNALTLADNADALITWCDHLDEFEWKVNFLEALKSYPLRAPW
jgi:hypothetical protein